MSVALQVVKPDLEAFAKRLERGESLTIEEQHELLGVVADLLARRLIEESRHQQ